MNGTFDELRSGLFSALIWCALKRLTLTRVALRSLFLEASWNHQGQQNLGLAAAIDPALRELYPAGPGLGEARTRAMSFFNTNPIASGLVMGLIIKMEEDLAAGRRTVKDRNRVAANVGQGMAALGDAFFWESWLPLCCLSAVLAGLSLGYWWTPLLLPLLFCLPALPVRFLGLILGYRQGEKALKTLIGYDVQRLIANVRRATAFMVGASTAVLVVAQSDPRPAGVSGRLWLTMAGAALCVFLLKALFKKVRRLDYWYPVVFVIVACVLLLVLNYD